MRSVLLVSLLFCSSAPVLAAHQKGPAPRNERQQPKAKAGTFSLPGAEKVVFKTVGEKKLHLHIFKPEGWKSTDQRPAIVYFFGGGWNGGSPEQFLQHCKYFASRGMVAATAEYRVKSRDNAEPFQCVADGKSAVRWLRANAKELGIDPDRIAAGGGSAGGHVAAATGLVSDFDEAEEDQEISSVPNALVLFNPVYDNGPKGYGHSRVKEYWEKISPMHNIREGAPPAIVFLGSNDALVPVSTAEAFKKKMEDAGSKSVLEVYDGQPHGFFNFGRSDNKFYIDTVTKADRFLASLGYLEGEPTLGQ